MGSGHEQLLLHTEVRWLSRGRCVTAVVWAARGGEVVFDRNQIRSGEASGWHYVACVSVLFGRYIWPLEWPQPVFARPRNSYFAPCRQSARLHTKTRPLAWPHQSRELRHVPSLADFITDAGTSHDFSSLFQAASEHLSAMRKQFATYFKEDYRSFAWVRDPFVCTANKLSIDMQEQLIELKSDSRLKELFSSCPLSSFWAALMQEYPELCDVALKILLPFASTYLCEAGFSKMTALKTKYRNRAQIEDDLRLCLSNIEPKIEDLCKAKQAQVSH